MDCNRWLKHLLGAGFFVASLGSLDPALAQGTNGYWITLVNNASNRAHIDPATIKVETEAGAWDVPLHRVRRAAFFGDESPRVQLTFPSGHIVPGNLLSRKLIIINMFGERHPATFDLIRSIEQPELGDPEGNLGEVLAATVVYEDGESTEANLAFQMLEISGRFAEYQVPSSMLRSVRRSPGSSRYEIDTLLGEQFVGKISPSSFYLVGNEELQRNKWSQIKSLTIKKQSVELPPDFMLWTHENGEKFAARIADEAIPVARANSGVETLLNPAAVKSIQLDPGGYLQFSSGDESLYATPEKSSVRLQVLGGSVEKFTWRNLVSAIGAGPRPPIRPFVPPTPPVTTPPNVVGTDLPPLQSIPPPPTFTDDPPLEPALEPEEPLAQAVRVRGGKFKLGRSAQEGDGLDDEKPAIDVSVDDFFMDETEVTVKFFQRFVESENYRTDAEKTGEEETWKVPGFRQTPEHPVVRVSWNDAVQFCNWRSAQEGLEPCYVYNPDEGSVVCLRQKSGYRLPTEAEWEYAVRGGGQTRRYPWGAAEDLNQAVRFANFAQRRGQPFDGSIKTSEVKKYPANTLGIHDLAGNVWEWCEDWYHKDAYFFVLPQKNPANPCVETGDVEGLERKSMRGGSWYNDLDFLRCSSRASGPPSASANRIGFRCVRTARPTTILDPSQP